MRTHQPDVPNDAHPRQQGHGYRAESLLQPVRVRCRSRSRWYVGLHRGLVVVVGVEPVAVIGQPSDDELDVVACPARHLVADQLRLLGPRDLPLNLGHLRLGS
jgi:hypothetical protein